MGRRSARKTKPAKLNFEVTDQAEAGAPSRWNLESGLVLVTLLALLISFVLIQIEMSSSYGSTWPF